MPNAVGGQEVFRLQGGDGEACIGQGKGKGRHNQKG